MVRESSSLAMDVINDDRPIAQRRKRRASTNLGSPQKSNTATGGNSTDQKDQSTAKTPTKPKKKVRFSDPFPETSSASSTGITPFVRRTTIEPCQASRPPTPRLLARAPRRRASMPNIPATMPPFEPSSTLELSSPIEVQFAPLRQVLSGRMKRQLRRNHLSEELNEIESDKKEHARRKQEIEQLREELALARQLGNEVAGSSEDSGNSDRIRELEDELVTLKTEMQGRSMTVDPDPSTPMEDDAVSLVASRSPTSASTETDFVTVDTLPETLVTLSSVRETTDTSTQTILTSSSLSTIQAHLKAQTEHLIRARLDLERLYPGETALTLKPTDANAQPLLEALLARLRTTRAELQASSTALANLQTQESNLRAQFKTTLQQLDAARASSVAAQRDSDAAARVTELEANVDEKERSIGKLAAALTSYRAEVASLEALITRLEEEGRARQEALRAEADEAVADLECRVAAETRGRREAEDECEVRSTRIRGLELRERELLEVVR